MVQMSKIMPIMEQEHKNGVFIKRQIINLL